MKVTCIGSGSDGNCWYCETDKGTGFFVDAGCPPKTIIDLGIDIANKPFFVTHEHGDHAKYAMGLHEQYGTTIIATPGTLQAIGLLPRNKEIEDVPLLTLGSPDMLGPFDTILSIPVIHNAAEPCAFYLHVDGESILYLMDAGQIPELPRVPLHTLIVEANYTPGRMAENAEKSKSELYVSGRVSSGVGHLSSREACKVAARYFPSLELLIFGHLSKNNFDIVEFSRDDQIPKQVKKKAKFATAGIAWNTIPF